MQAINYNPGYYRQLYHQPGLGLDITSLNTTKFYFTEGQNLDAMCQFTDRYIH